jgi:hypothetical protein
LLSIRQQTLGGFAAFCRQRLDARFSDRDERELEATKKAVSQNQKNNQQKI